MPRETVGEKARRLLSSGCVTVLHVDLAGGEVRAHVRGDTGERRVRFTAGRWACSCPAPGPGCAHLVALALIVVPFEPPP